MNDKDLSLSYLCFDSPLGWILPAAGPKGLCLLHLCGSTAPSDSHIRMALLSAYPERLIHLESPTPLLRDVQQAVLRYLEEKIPLPFFALDLSLGTPFRQKVWRALCEIPFGETRSYRQIAQSVGLPQGARAVGQACAQNPIALIVPCHRVVAGNGGLGGYSGGLEIKEALLHLEQPGINS